MTANTAQTVQGRDPRTGAPLGEPVPQTTQSEVARTAERAAAVFEAWRDFGREGRAAALDAVADSLDAHKDELVALADGETALGPVRLGGEVGRTTGQLRLFAGVLREGGYQDIVIEPADAARATPDLRRISRPLGPVAVFAASNFPFAFSVAGGDTASALAAGCPVIVKAHEGHPRTSLRTAELVSVALAGAGAPEGVFAIVFGFEAGVTLIEHPAIAAAGFTGSARGGLALAKACAERPHPIPFYGELGSVNPVFVLPGAAAGRPEEIARGYAASLTLGVGQFCTNPGLLFVPAAALKEQIGAAVAETGGGPMLAERMHDSLDAATAELGERDGVKVLASGKPAEGPWSAGPVVFEVGLPVFAADSDFLREERFGPVGLVVDYPGEGSQGAQGSHPLLELIDRGALGTGHLTATIHLDPQDAADVALAGQLARRLQQLAGRIVFNGWPTGVAVTRAQHHGGPYPATTAPAYTSVGSAAIRRWLAPVVYQDCPPALLPEDLRTADEG
ncbi:MAG TPA: aldehyde dehydrogenase (NADP(+)) [Actinocrinis sp.]|jgi:NADP-dependent aldehyde dehydrogenase